jgi:hypothetical protein
MQVKITPKKPRLIICPHCHMIIKADEFREHLTIYKEKKLLKMIRDKLLEKITDFNNFENNIGRDLNPSNCRPSYSQQV